jgi:hypothetical protein
MENESFQSDAFKFQLEILKLELQTINGIIGRINDLTYKIKNWAIVIWAGSIALILGNNENFNDYLLYTAILPIMFWFVDAWLRRTERSFIFRTYKISEYLNSDDYYESFKLNKIINLRLLDYRAKSLKNTEEYKNFTTVKRTFLYKELSIYYFAMFLLSILFSFVIK